MAKKLSVWLRFQQKYISKLHYNTITSNLYTITRLLVTFTNISYYKLEYVKGGSVD